MKIFNLSSRFPEVEYKVSKFPDGQKSVIITNMDLCGENRVYIKTRLTSFNDLEILLGATAALREFGVKDISVFITYFIGARSDRKFVDGGSNYIKSVISPIINLQGYSEVTVLDPHSDVIEACINNFRKKSNKEFADKCFKDIRHHDENLSNSKITIISPDAGALKKVYDIAGDNGIKDVIVASKVRDVAGGSGKILFTDVPLNSSHTDDRTYIIYDDIFDGGRTFIEIAKVVREKLPNANLYLCVTHGIFSSGLLELSNYFTKIYSTNSYSDIEAGEHSDYTVKSDFLKQFEVI